MEHNFELILTIVTVVIGIIVAYGTILKIKYMREDRKPKFSHQRVKDNTGWKILIHSPNTIIHKFSISIDEEKLFIENSTNHLQECTLMEGDGVNFVVPENISEDSNVVIKFDQYKKSMKYKDITLYRDSL